MAVPRAAREARERATALAAPLIAAGRSPGATQCEMHGSELAQLVVAAAHADATHVPVEAAWGFYATARLLTAAAVERLEAALAADAAAGRMPLAGEFAAALRATVQELSVLVGEFAELRENRARRAWSSAGVKLEALHKITTRRAALDRLLDS